VHFYIAFLALNELVFAPENATVTGITVCAFSGELRFWKTRWKRTSKSLV